MLLGMERKGCCMSDLVGSKNRQPWLKLKKMTLHVAFMVMMLAIQCSSVEIQIEASQLFPDQLSPELGQRRQPVGEDGASYEVLRRCTDW
ncbi:hypothetical protein ACLOJK_007469, partial [Asimina triloba]